MQNSEDVVTNVRETSAFHVKLTIFYAKVNQVLTPTIQTDIVAGFLVI